MSHLVDLYTKAVDVRCPWSVVSRLLQGAFAYLPIKGRLVRLKLIARAGRMVLGYTTTDN